MLSSATALSFALILPAVFAQSSTNTSATDNSAPVAAPASGTGAAFTPPTVSGTSCGTTQQNFNQCVTKVSKDISNCPSTGYVCLCQTYANLAACYNACPDLPDGATWKDQSHQYCQQANISDTGSISNQTTPATTTALNSTTGSHNTTATNTTTPLAAPASNVSTSSVTGSRSNTSSASAATSTPGSFARNSAQRCMGVSSSLIALAVGACAMVFA